MERVRDMSITMHHVLQRSVQQGPAGSGTNVPSARRRISADRLRVAA